ncbi:MAG: HPF/RaiA family ribosome-associated protein [Aquabacterium sp.]|nr:HPF/RaiA family ribosome-associated protein [Aquabacterium sp.]
MQVQINTDKNIKGGLPLSNHVQALLETRLRRFRDRLTRIEAHLSDENGHKPGSGGDDKRCVMEARPRGLQPLAVTNVASNLDQALTGACEKLERLLESTLGQLDDPRGKPIEKFD